MSYGCSTLTPAVPDVNVLTPEWPELADNRLWGLVLSFPLFFV
jgi:hypothetical protein